MSKSIKNFQPFVKNENNVRSPGGGLTHTVDAIGNIPVVKVRFKTLASASRPGVLPLKCCVGVISHVLSLKSLCHL